MDLVHAIMEAVVALAGPVGEQSWIEFIADALRTMAALAVATRVEQFCTGVIQLLADSIGLRFILFCAFNQADDDARLAL